MIILLISYGIIEYDGRLIELYNMVRNLGEVTLICCGDKNDNPDIHTISIKNRKYLSVPLYLKFVLKILSTVRKTKKFDAIFVDNYLASPAGLLLKKILKDKIIIQDIRELYFSEDMLSFKGKILQRAEVKLLKLSNVLLVANEYRADIIMEKYDLNKRPIVFENVRVLPKTNHTCKTTELIHDISRYRIKVVSTGGLSIKRLTGRLVESMSKLPSDYGLIIIGEGSEKDYLSLKAIIDRYELSNVHIVGKVKLEDLFNLVKHCDIGIVNYHKEDLNNQYCASGKVYEYLDAGLPIVTTENIPLKDFCDNYGVGLADDNFYKGIFEVGEKLELYKSKVSKYMKNFSVKNYNEEVASRILDELELKD